MSFTITTEYVTQTCCHEGCGVEFAFTRAYYNVVATDHRWWYCPNGHQQRYAGKTDAEKRLDQATQRADRLGTLLRAEQDQSQAAQREAAESKASEVRIRWRVGNGVCPCCQRTFPGLAAHVASKHPEFVTHDLDRLSTRQRELLATLRKATEDADAAVIDARDIGAHMNTVRSLVTRGLVAQVEYDRIALTEAGWPLAEQAAR